MSDAVPAEPAAFPYLRPRIKREHRPLRRVDRTVQIGGDIYGIASVLDDPDGWIWEAMRLLDGERSPDQVAAGSSQSPDAVRSLLDALYDAGFLEDAAAQDSMILSAQEQERYSRNQAFYRWVDLTPRPSAWTVQEKIRAASVVVLGVGGAGSSAAMALAAAGVGRLHVVDPDVVELSNLTRQFLYTEEDLGRPKVEAAVQRLRAINSGVTVTGEQAAVRSEQDLKRLTARCDVFALCADSPDEIAHWATRACAATGTPWVTGGYIGPLTQVMTFVPGTGPCFECLHLHSKQASSAAPAAIDEPGPPTNQENSASVAASAGLCGMLFAHAVLAHITGAPDFGANLAFGINLAAPDEHVYAAPERNPHCPVCGDGRPSDAERVENGRGH